MASNGIVVAESNPEPETACAGKAGSTSPAAPKPEVARKPAPPGTKPCPPIPKKPPVAHKPASLSVSPHHGSHTPGRSPVLPSTGRNPHSADPGASTPNTLPPSAQPSCLGQGVVPQSHVIPPGTAPKPTGKVPPPLPKTPPKGTPPAGKSGKGPPPRPSPLAVSRKPPPPVPAKKPVRKAPAVPQNTNQDITQSEEVSVLPSEPSHSHSHSYQQLVVRDNSAAVVRQSETPLLPACENEITSVPKSAPYQQVIVEENSSKCAQIHLDANPEEDLSPRHIQSESSENAQSQQKSQNIPRSSPLLTYEDIIVEENSRSHLNVDANVVCKTEECVRECEEEESSPEKQNILPDDDGDDDHTEVLSLKPKDGTNTDDAEDQVGADFISVGDGNAKSNETQNTNFVESATDSSSFSHKKHSANNHFEEEKSAKGDQCADGAKQFPKRPPRPSVPPPPVRPKPKKRVSLLRQTQVTGEDCAQDTVSPSPPCVREADFPPQWCTTHPDTVDPSTQEAVYQEIDPEPTRETPGGSETSNSITVDRTQDTNITVSDQSAKDVVLYLESCSESTAGEGKSKTENVEKDHEQSICFEDNIPTADGSDSVKATADSVVTDTEGNPQETQTASHPVAQEAEGTDRSTDQKDLSGVSQELPEKPDSISFDDVGETSFMLKEIEQLLTERLGPVQTLAEADTPSADTSNAWTSSQSFDTPVRPPRPKRADKLRKLTIGSCSADSSSTESLTSVGLPGKKPPPKPKRKNLPGAVNRSLSDVTGMKSYVDQLNNKEEEEEEEKPYLPPRQQSLRIGIGLTPPPLPPRNKSMERITDAGVPQDPKPEESEVNIKEGDQTFSTAERRASVPNAKTTTASSGARNSFGGRANRKSLPRPTRRAPPPPSHPPCRPLSASIAQSGASPKEHSSSSGEKVSGYQKISNGFVSAKDDINTVVPKTAVVADMNSPSPAEVSMDHDYHEIPDHLVQEIICEQTTELPAEKSKEGTPPPDLPPRSGKPLQPPTITTSDPPSEISDLPNAASSETKLSSNDTSSKAETSSVEEELSSSHEAESGGGGGQSKRSSHLSVDDSVSLSSQRSSRPESFCSEVLGSLAHVVGEHHRPDSTHSCSSHSETGSGEVEVPTFDHSSASESENEDDEEKKGQKREKKVYYIVEEVVKSEKVFVDVLKLLNVDFRVFMSTKTEQAGHPIVPAETLNKILDFLPQLQSFNEMLLKDLTDRIANWEKQKKIADIFVKKGPFLKLYSSYIRNFEHASALLDETCKKHNGFGMALQQFELSPRCASLALKHYMLKPIQRIPQYKLLLQDYLKHLDPDSLDYKDTITALNIVSEVADHANESMRHGDNVQKLLEIQRSLIGQFEVIQPGRVLIRQGELMKMSRKEMQPRMFFLFSDVLLYTTPTATGYRLNNILPLQGMKVLPPKLEEFNNEFNIITTQRSFTVATSTPEEREEWLRALWNAIEENSERYHTFKAMQPEPKTSLLDKDFVLGTKAPLWVPDARVTMCMLCLAEFSITWRRHHCRACGRIICGNCSENKAPLRYLMYKPARVCDECFEKLAQEVEEGLEKEEKSEGGKAPSTSTPTATVSSSPVSPSTAESSVLSFSSLKARFQKIRKSAREKRKSGLARPSVLKEVRANDEGSDMSGYLWVAKNKKWKRLWFVVKGKVLYTYKASEDMAAIESMPLLGFEVTRMTSWYQGAEPDLMFELHHQNTQPLIFKPRSASVASGGSGGDRSSLAPSEDGPHTISPTSLSPHVKSSADTTTPRLIFRTDSAAATTKWVTVLREASLA